MKKLLLLLVISICFMSSTFAQLTRAHWYLNCNGIRSSNPIAILDDLGSFPCINLCTSCKLEVAYYFSGGNQEGWINFDRWSGYTFPNVGKQNVVVIGSNHGEVNVDIIVDEAETNGPNATFRKTYYSFEFTNFDNQSEISQLIFKVNFTYPFPPFGTYVIDEIMYADCLRFTTPNNKDNITLDSRQICKGECFYLKDLISGREDGNGGYKASISSWGCGSNAIGPAWNSSSMDLHYVCFNDVGSFPICAKVKDACGEKVLNASINVIDCENAIDCESCCEGIGQAIDNVKSWISPGNLFIPSSEIIGCGPVDYHIYYSNGTSTVARGSGRVNFGGLTISSICIIPAGGCPTCGVCIQISE